MLRKARLIRVLCAVLAVSALSLRAAGTDEATETFNALYGADLKRVRETGDARDDVELAARLLAAAKKATDQPAFLAILCEKAHDLALGHPTGYGTALAAMDLLARTVPEKAAACTARTLAIRQKQFDTSRSDARPPAAEALIDALVTAADAKIEAGTPAKAATLLVRARNVARAVSSPRLADLESRAKALTQRMATDRRISDLVALLEKNPQNTGAHEELVRLYLVDLDDPAGAAKHLAGAKDPSLLKYVPAAAKGVEAAPEFACLELGEWYARLAAKAPPHARGPMYARAKAYLERFLEIHTSKDLNRTRATLALGKIQEAVARLTAPPKKPTKTSKDEWIDLLPLTDPSKHALSGMWERRDEALALTGRASEAKVMPPLVIDGSYEFEARIARTSGGDTMGIVLPVGERQVLLGLGYGGNQAHGLGQINGRSARDPENPTVTKPARLQNGREYAVRARVLVQGSRAEIEVTLDGERIILWRGLPSALSMYAGWRLPQGRRIGFGASNSTAEFRAARLRMLSRTAKPLAPRTEQTVGPGQTVDVLAPVDLAADVVRGTWKRRGAVVALDRAMGYDRFMLPAAPNGSYSLHVEFVRTSGDGTVTVILPVGSAQVALLVSHVHGEVSGLELIRGVSPQNGNGTDVRTVRITNGRPYALDVTVALRGEEASIVAKLNGKSLVSWRGPVADLSLYPGWTLPQKGRVALGTTDATTVFRAARLRMLSGEARLLRQ